MQLPDDMYFSVREPKGKKVIVANFEGRRGDFGLEPGSSNLPGRFVKDDNY
jgi:hypothetical protein